MSRYDIAIIGTGPAGLSAAITATIRNKRVLLLGSRDFSEKLQKAHRIQNYLGFPAVSGQELAAAFRSHIDQIGIPITEKRINAVYAMGDYFALQSGDEMLEASAVILATGVVAGKPLPGEEELLGRGVSYCATCDAALYRGKTAIVLGYSAKEEEEAAFLAEIADHVTYLPMYEAGEGFGELEANPKITVRTGVKPLSIEKADALMRLRTDSGEDFDANGIFVLREAIAPSQLVPGLETEGNAVVCDRQMKTNIAGLFVCGDIAGAPYQYIKAAGEGNVAALSAVSYLSALARK